MRLDHLAFRTKNRKKTAQFFIDAFGYRIQDEFTINFENGSKAQCIALEPPEKQTTNLDQLEWSFVNIVDPHGRFKTVDETSVYHIPPEIFVSDGEPGSPVHTWVQNRKGIGGLHHMAYQVESVEDTMEEWREKGYAEFSTEKPLTCPGLVQVFTKPSKLTGVIFEFIERDGQGFCKENVKNLMDSTKEFE